MKSILMFVLVLAGCAAPSEENEKSNEVVGKLLRKLVEKNVLTQNEAAELLSGPSIGASQESRTEAVGDNSTSAKAVKPRTQESEVVGSYERMIGNNTIRLVLREYGVFERYLNGEKETIEAKWEITKSKEIFVKDAGGNISILKVNTEGNIRSIAWIIGGKRTDLPKEKQYTAKKIK
jgi:hypothetical protein